MAMTKEEAALWAAGLKLLTDMVTMAIGRNVTVAELDAAIADEEVRSHMLEEQRRAALNEAHTG